MGDPKKQRKKYTTPRHPWQRDRLDEERKILKEYGLKNKKELWKFESLLRKFKSQAKILIASSGEQAEKESKQLLDRLYRLNLITKDTKIEDVLGLSLQNVLDRRLQTVVVNQGLARSAKQARQFVVHGHICVKDRKIDIPSYLVLRDEEVKIKFNPKSSVANEDHPERIKDESVKQEIKKGKEKPKKEEKQELKKEEKPKELKKESPKEETKQEEKKEEVKENEG